MKRNRRVILSLVLIVGLIAFIIWIWNEWIVFTDSDERIPGRDTVAFWSLKEKGFVYEIGRFGNAFNFLIYDSPSRYTSGFSEIENVHFYANTSDYIFIITLDNLSYCVEKNTGVISSSSLFDVVPSTEEQICFINLLNEKKSHFSKEYR